MNSALKEFKRQTSLYNTGFILCTRTGQVENIWGSPRRVHYFGTLYGRVFSQAVHSRRYYFYLPKSHLTTGAAPNGVVYKTFQVSTSTDEPQVVIFCELEGLHVLWKIIFHNSWKYPIGK